MGLGKTATALTAIWDGLIDGWIRKAALVIAPIRVCETVWEDEAKSWVHLQDLKFSLIRGTPKQRLEALKKPADVYLINPELVPWLFMEALRKKEYPFDVLFIDESSMFKSPGSRRFKVLKYRIKRFARRYIMTGTPSPNGLLDIWAQIYILDEGEALGYTMEDYKDRYFFPVDPNFSKWVPKKGALESIEKAIAPITVRMDAEDYLELPQIVPNDIFVDLPGRVRRLYESFERELFTELESGLVDHFTAPSRSMKCHQAVQGAVYLDENSWEEIHTAKLEALQEVMEGTGDNVLVCYQFKHDLTRLREWFKDYEPVHMGGRGGKSTVEIRDAWNARKIRMLLLHPASAAHGLNLQFGGSTVAFFGLTWNLEHYMQTIRRLARPGQNEKRVIVHRIRAKNTIDDALCNALRSKDRTQTHLLDALRKYAHDKKTLNRR